MQFLTLIYQPAMRKINIIFFVIVLSLLLLSAASIAFSQTTRKTLELPDFKSIFVNSNYTVMLKQTNKQESHRGSAH